MKATLINAVLLVGVSLLVTPACATYPPGPYHHRDTYRDSAWGQQRAYDRGYDHGMKAGIKDWNHRRRFDPWRHGRYRSADSGYSSRYGPRSSYARAYRSGFRTGYEYAYGPRGGRRTRHW